MSFLTPLLLRSITASQDVFIKESGRSFRLRETGLSTSAAVIAVVDWALEFPQPLPPRMHVSALTATGVVGNHVSSDRLCCHLLA